MLQLYRKQLRAHFVLAALFAFAAWRTGLVAPSFVGSDGRIEVTGFGIAPVWGVFGLFLGFDGYQRERTADTYSMLRHRGVSGWRVIAARAAASYSVLVAVFGVACVVELVQAPVLPTRGVAFSSGHAAVAALAASSALLGHSTGVLCAQLRRSRWMRVLIALLAGVGMFVWTLQWQSFAGDRLLPNEFAWLAWIVSVSAVLYFLAAHAFRRAFDETRPFEGWIRTASGLAVLSCIAPTALSLAGHFQWRAVRDHALRLPSIETDSAGVRLVGALPLDRRHTLAAQFEPVQRVERWQDADDPSDPRHVPHLSPFQFGEHWKPLVAPGLEGVMLADRESRLFRRELRFGVRSGRVLCRTLDRRLHPVKREPQPRIEVPDGVTLPFSLELKRSDGRRFSRQTWLLRDPDDVSSLLADNADRTLWKIDASTAIPSLQRVELPGGDEWQGFEIDASRADPWDFSEAPRRNGANWIRGLKATYVWSARGLVKSPLHSPGRTAPEATTQFLDDDLLEPHVIVRNARGDKSLEHRYSLEARDAMEIYAFAALRSPLAGLAAFSGLDSSAVTESAYPLYVSGRRPWLLAANAALSALAASFLVHRRALGLQRAWWLIALLTGPLAWLCVALIEPWRRPQPPPAAHRRRPRIAGRARPAQAQLAAVHPAD